MLEQFHSFFVHRRLASGTEVALLWHGGGLEVAVCPPGKASGACAAVSSSPPAAQAGGEARRPIAGWGMHNTPLMPPLPQKLASWPAGCHKGHTTQRSPAACSGRGAWAADAAECPLPAAGPLN